MEEKKWKHVHTGGGNAVYCIGLLGALYYFLRDAGSLEEVVMGILQSIFWPGVLVFKAFELLKM